MLSNRGVNTAAPARKARRAVTGHDHADTARVIIDGFADNVKSSQPAAASIAVWASDTMPIEVPVGDADHVEECGEATFGAALVEFDQLYPQENGESALQHLQIQLATPLPSISTEPTSRNTRTSILAGTTGTK
jgi:hypothetical protein